MTQPDRTVSADRMVADPADPTITRAQQGAREAAEDAEFDALLTRLRAHQPTFGCFCGSLDDLRRTVADLDRRHHHRSAFDRSAARSADAQTGGLLASSLAPSVPPEAGTDAPPDTRSRGWDAHRHRPAVVREVNDPPSTRAGVAGSEPDPLLGARIAGIRARQALDAVDTGVGDDEELRREQLTQWHADDTLRRPEITADLINTTPLHSHPDPDPADDSVDGPCGGSAVPRVGEAGRSR